MKKAILYSLSFLIVVVVSLVVWNHLSPRPMALAIRWIFDQGAIKASRALEKHLPNNVTEILDIQYDKSDIGAFLDVYRPKDSLDKKFPAIIWVHGGGFISGQRQDIKNYLKIIASKGFVVFNVDYTYAPEAQYPTPVRQLSKALNFINTKDAEYSYDKNKLFFAGDSAGAQIVGQMANIISSPEYAKNFDFSTSVTRDQLRGLILHCGAYDASLVKLDGPFGFFLKTVFWSYFGTKDFLNSDKIKEFSLLGHLSPNYPPLFISVGNDDPLRGQSFKLAEIAKGLGIEVETLFYPTDYAPALAHEYQFDLDSEAGKLALEKSIAFIKRKSN
jgi:acetyl esterase/lipase